MECQFKYENNQIWNMITDTFCYLPIAALLNKKSFAIHGGITPELQSIEQLNTLDSFLNRISGANFR